MAKTVEFEGKQYEFPDDASTDEISQALQSHPSTGAAAAPQQTLADKYKWGVDWKTGNVSSPFDALANPEDRQKILGTLPGYLRNLATGLVTGTKDTLAAPGAAFKAGEEGNVPSVDQMVAPATNMALLMAGSRGMGAPQVGRTAGAVAAPTEEALGAARNADYQAVRDSGLAMKVDPVAAKTNAALTEMDKAGTLETSPTSAKVLRSLGENPEPKLENLGGMMAGEQPRYTAPRTVGVGDILDAQQALAKPIQGENPAGRAIALKHLHSMLEDIAPEDVVAGSMSPAEASATIKRAAGNSKALYNSQILTNAETRAENNAISANSGNNVGNNLRQQMKALVQPRLNGPSPYVRTMSPELEAAVNKSMAGSQVGNAARSIGNLFGGGGGIGRLFAGEVGGNIAGELSHVPGAHLAGFALGTGIGGAGRAIDNAIVRHSVSKLGELARAQSPLGKQTGALATNKTYGAMRRLLADQAIHKYINSLNTNASP